MMGNLLNKLIKNRKLQRSPTTYRTGRKASRLMRFFERKSGVHGEVIRRISYGGARIDEAVSADELVAILTIWSTCRPIHDVIQAIAAIEPHGWFRAIEADFFQAVEGSAGEFDRRGWVREASDLLKLGSITAKMYRQSDWHKRFQDQIHQRVNSRIGDLPFLKQRGW